MLVEPLPLLQPGVDLSPAALPADSVIITIFVNTGSQPGSVLYARNGEADGATSALAHHVAAAHLLEPPQPSAFVECCSDAFSSFQE